MDLIAEGIKQGFIRFEDKGRFSPLRGPVLAAGLAQSGRKSSFRICSKVKGQSAGKADSSKPVSWAARRMASW